MKSQRRFAPKSDRNKPESVACLAGISKQQHFPEKAPKFGLFWHVTVLVWSLNCPRAFISRSGLMSAKWG